MSRSPSADQHDTAHEVILGVDTHKDVHVTAAVSSHGVLLDTRSFPTTAGYQAILDWATALGLVRRAGDLLGVAGRQPCRGAGAGHRERRAAVGCYRVARRPHLPGVAHRARHSTEVDALPTSSVRTAMSSERLTDKRDERTSTG
jgi:hypothetical protein